MEYFSITKTDVNYNIEECLSLKEGYKFNQKIKITLYNQTMIKYILIKKINTSLRNIINMILSLDNDEDEDGILEISAKIETLRKILIGKYSKYIGIKETEDYLKKLDKLEERVGTRKVKKSMRR